MMKTLRLIAWMVAGLGAGFPWALAGAVPVAESAAERPGTLANGQREAESEAEAVGTVEPPTEKPARGEAGEATGHVFAWPFRSWEEMRPRGGMTQGAEVSLRSEPKEAWQRLWEPGLSKRERDRRAILAMAGSYRVSFDFIETLGFGPGYKPPRPYFSWGTELVEVLADGGDFLSLQHTLVMYFKDAQGAVSEPQVMKHWRQDWKWQPAEILRYAGAETWERVKTPEPQGRWSQTVYQVDDSPRYATVGAWTHDGGLSTWRSDMTPRPLPRREFSVRDDYNILEGTHEITLAPTGWLHVQNNRKLRLAADGSKTYVGTELGVDRYEEITSPELKAAWQPSWEKTAAYWAAVRGAWDEVIATRKRFSLRDEVDGKKLFQEHFERAAQIETAEKPDPAADAEHARETVRKFLK